MAYFVFSGFADEISPSLDEQIKGLQSLHIEYIEPRVVDGKNIADLSVEEARSVHARLRDAGIAVSAMGSPIGKIGIDEPFEPHLDKFKHLLDVSHEMQADAIRLFSFFIPKGEDAERFRGAVIDRMGRIVKAARGSGITLLHENEKEIYGDVPDRCVELFEAFPDELFCTYDPSNFVQCGVENKWAFEQLLPYIRYMHIKDSLYTQEGTYRDHGFEGVSDAHRPAGMGDGEIEYILTRLTELDYQGFLSIEPHLSANDAFGITGLEKFSCAAKALRSLLRTIGA